MIVRWLAIFAILSALPFTAAYGEPPPVVRAEVDYLLQYIESSGCAFYRNGSWYDGARAKAHLRDKYDYLVSRNRVGTAEDFIDKGATKSSLSGEPYKIRCGTGAEVASGRWLHEALARYRASRRDSPAS